MRIPILFTLFIGLFGCGKKFDTVVDREPKFATTRNLALFKEHVTEFILAENAVTQQKNISGLLSNPQAKLWAEEQATNLMQSIPINLYDLSIDYKAEEYIGVCVKSSKSGKREILIDANYWNRNPNSRTVLMLHELGHCWPSVEREHYVIPIGSSCRSIMEAKLISYNDYTKYKDYLGYELFKKLPILKSTNPSASAPCQF